MWWIWLVVALGAAIAEIAASGLIFGGLAASSLAAAIVSIFVPGLLPGAVVFAAASVIYLIVLRPTVLGLLTGRPQHRLAAPGSPEALMGRRAVATQEISANGGQIRIGTGEYWSARPYDSKDVIAEGTVVEIAHVDGLTALVWRPA